MQAGDLSPQTVCFGDFFKFFFLSVKCKCVLATFILEILLLRVVQHRWWYSPELVTADQKRKCVIEDICIHGILQADATFLCPRSELSGSRLAVLVGHRA